MAKFQANQDRPAYLFIGGINGYSLAVSDGKIRKDVMFSKDGLFITEDEEIIKFLRDNPQYCFEVKE